MNAPATLLRDQLAQFGIASRRHERWRRTPLDRLSNLVIAPMAQGYASSPDSGKANEGKCQLVLGEDRLNLDAAGIYAPFIRQLDPGQPGCDADEWSGFDVPGSTGSNRQAGYEIARLNRACPGLWIAIDIPAHFSNAEPLIITHHRAKPHQPGIIAPRLRLRLGAGADMTIIESGPDLGPDSGLVQESAFASVGDVVLERAARLSHWSLQHPGQTGIQLAARCYRLAEAARLQMVALSFGGALQRFETIVKLEGEGAHSDLAGLWVLHDQSHLDHVTDFRHESADASSRQIFRGILDDRASVAMQGRIAIGPGAAGSDATQNARAMLLSDLARADFKPELEIFNHDVACSHGAALGMLDPDQIHYLQTRGIDPEMARQLLLEGFIHDALDDAICADDMIQGCESGHLMVRDLISRALHGRSWGQP
ncbi:MAG: SufD family Fe-S cluster assembly protein [Pseudomonadota bacterium]